jgi:two-component system phosphate regulon sensor histidine kinase PhoR
MKKKKIIADPLLMLLTILVVTGFQGYWLYNTYSREQKTLEIKSQVSFQETVRRLQASKLKLQLPFGPDSMHQDNVRIYMDDEIHDLQPGMMKTRLPQEEIITMVNAVRNKMYDSLKTIIPGAPPIVIGMKNRKPFPGKDSVIGKQISLIGNKDKLFKMLYGVDSLQDSLRTSEMDSAYRLELGRQHLNVPFHITRLDSAKLGDLPGISDVTVGFAHPVTYHLSLGNSFPYIFKKILLPVIFSIFLVGMTILSFLLLYRNLMRQQRLTEIKNEFISNITHELKTPIATVGVAIEALKSFNAMQDPQKTREYLDISANELQRLSLLVDKVLKLSMFEKKEIELRYEVLDVKEVVDEVLSSMRLQLEKRRATATVATSGDVHLQADRLHLLSVVFNLLDNALKYTKDEPQISILVEGDEKNVRLQMKDNGIGIPPEYKNKVFEKFFRVPTGNTHDTKGYGLGLSYASHVVKKHRGTISVESQPGVGTIFTIVLPKTPA